MFSAVPLETKPSWRSPPWMTLLLIALNRLVFFGWQLPEERAVNKAAAAYAKTPLAAIELPQFVQHLQNQARQSGKSADRQRADMAEYCAPMAVMVASSSNRLSAARRLKDWINTISVAGSSSDEIRLATMPSTSLCRPRKPMSMPCPTSTPKNFQGQHLPVRVGQGVGVKAVELDLQRFARVGGTLFGAQR